MSDESPQATKADVHAVRTDLSAARDDITARQDRTNGRLLKVETTLYGDDAAREPGLVLEHREVRRLVLNFRAVVLAGVIGIPVLAGVGSFLAELLGS